MLHNHVSSSSIVVSVQTVSSVWLNVGSEVACWDHWEVHADRGWNGWNASVSSGKTVTTTVWKIVLTSEHHGWSSVVVHHGERAKGEELSRSDGLLGLGLKVGEQEWVELTWVQELVLVGLSVGGNNVSIDVGLWWWKGGDIDWRKVVEERCSVDVGKCLNLSCGNVAESKWLIEVGQLEVSTGSEESNEAGVHGETGQDDTIGDVWVHVDESVSLSRSEGVSDVGDFAEGAVDAWYSCITERACDLSKSSNLEERLKSVQSGIWCSGVGRVSDTETVVRECAVT